MKNIATSIKRAYSKNQRITSDFSNILKELEKKSVKMDSIFEVSSKQLELEIIKVGENERGGPVPITIPIPPRPPKIDYIELLDSYQKTISAIVENAKDANEIKAKEVLSKLQLTNKRMELEVMRLSGESMNAGG